MKAKVNAIAAHGITCFVNRQLIYNYPESLLAEQGIMSIEHAVRWWLLVSIWSPQLSNHFEGPGARVVALLVD